MRSQPKTTALSQPVSLSAIRPHHCMSLLATTVLAIPATLLAIHQVAPRIALRDSGASMTVPRGFTAERTQLPTGQEAWVLTSTQHPQARISLIETRTTVAARVLATTMADNLAAQIPDQIPNVSVRLAQRRAGGRTGYGVLLAGPLDPQQRSNFVAQTFFTVEGDTALIYALYAPASIRSMAERSFHHLMTSTRFPTVQPELAALSGSYCYTGPASSLVSRWTFDGNGEVSEYEERTLTRTGTDSSFTFGSFDNGSTRGRYNVQGDQVTVQIGDSRYSCTVDFRRGRSITSLSCYDYWYAKSACD